MVLVSHTLFAQFKMIAESPLIDEPEKGFTKILLLKNGYTAYFHFSKKDGFDVKLYDEKHQLKVEKHHVPSYNKLKSASIEGLFEINGNIVLMVSEWDDKTPVLYRFVIDGKTAGILSTESIAQLDRLNYPKRAALKFDVPIPGFWVKKDPGSDHYALAMMHSFESDRNKRIEVIYYGPDHKEIGHAFYTSPEGKYKYMNYIDMAVIGRQTVCILAYGYNTKASGGEEEELVIANLDAGAKEVRVKKLDFTHNVSITGAIVRYNPGTKKLNLLASALKDRKSNTVVSYLVFLDPFTGVLDAQHEIYPAQAVTKSFEVFGSKDPFKGTPQNFHIQPDGSFAVMYEEAEIYMSFEKGKTDNGGLNRLAIGFFDVMGKEIRSYLVPKRQYMYHTPMYPFYQLDRETRGQEMHWENQYKSFTYLSGPKKSYVLMNDIERNREAIKKGKLVMIQGVHECDAYYFPLNGEEVMPDRAYFFGHPENKKIHNMSMFTISSYNHELNLLATLKMEDIADKKNVRIVWLNPE
ncbi:hypothetical protein OI18_19135 [Flavihumibacter solisilvae]|uniref:Uncharacterized protein n=2 Tax=Flavihumibacter solisilvae TaxID=1349421 RepID=A0A0C1IRR3_9BACT|nr:hypothetical protein OI18_19135 [Flavihumibacter solisilvae]